MYYSGQKEAIQEKVAIYREAASFYQDLRKVFTDFDGKVFNCRLQKALNEQIHGKEIRHVFAEKRYQNLNIGFYHHGNQITLATVTENEMPDGKRIPGSKLIESAQSKREYLLKQAADIERYSEQVPAIKQQIEYLDKQLENIVNKIPYEVRDIYGLNYHVRRY